VRKGRTPERGEYASTETATNGPDDATPATQKGEKKRPTPGGGGEEEGNTWRRREGRGGRNGATPPETTGNGPRRKGR
jgi:hypothetical protein